MSEILFSYSGPPNEELIEDISKSLVKQGHKIDVYIDYEPHSCSSWVVKIKNMGE